MNELIKPLVETPGELPKTLPLPDFVEKFIIDRPWAETLITEMAESDPVTFLHCLMVAEGYSLMRKDFVKRIITQIPAADLSKIDKYLSSYEIPVLFHDLGKWMLDPDVERSVQIINIKPPQTADIPITHLIDQRTDLERTLHKLHPLTGGFAATELPEVLPPIPDISGKKGKLLTFGLHENITGNTYRERSSYPRSRSRLNKPYEKLVLLLAQISDTAMAMGQPRSYRTFRLENQRILQVFNEFIDDAKLIDIFGPKTEGELMLLRGSLIDIAFSALRNIQQKYREPTCFDPPSFTVFDRDLTGNSGALQELAKITWNNHEERLMETIESIQTNQSNNTHFPKKRNQSTVYVLNNFPSEWFSESLPKMQESTQLYQSEGVEQAENWFKETGIKPEDTNFSIIIPIHNEEEYLSSVFTALMMNDIPPSAHVKIIFVANGCTDNGKSEEIIRNFLGTIGNVEIRSLNNRKEFPVAIPDPNLESDYAYVRKGNLEFLHLTTDTLGKANALNIGNKIAAFHGPIDPPPIAMCLDANDFPEPDAMRELFKVARQQIFENSEVVVVSGKNQPLFKTKSRYWNNILHQYRDLAKQTESPDMYITGGFFAWNTEFIEAIGGFPQVVGLDYALSVLTRFYRKEHLLASKAVIWKYKPSSIPRIHEMRARFLRGYLQVMAQNREKRIADIIMSDTPYLGTPDDRLKSLANKIRQYPHFAFWFFGSELLWLLALPKGKRDFHRDPSNISWEKSIES